MHINRNTDFVEIHKKAMIISLRITQDVWDGKIDGQFTTVHRLLDQLSGGEYDTNVLLNEAHELTNIISNLRNSRRDEPHNKRVVQAETLEMSIARLSIVGLYSFFDSTFVSELSKYDQNVYIQSVRRLMANFVAGVLTGIRNRDNLQDYPMWQYTRTQFQRILRTFFPSLHGNNPWTIFKTFLSLESPEHAVMGKFWYEGTSYIKAIYMSRVYEEFDRVELLSRDSLMHVCAIVYRDERQTFVEHFEEQI